MDTSGATFANPDLFAGSDRVSTAFRRLVAAGPEAIPTLLEHLTDARRTKDGIGSDDAERLPSVHFSVEAIPHDSANSAEVALLERLFPLPDRLLAERRFSESEDAAGRYPFCVGDVCYVALGLITNRRYAAAGLAGFVWIAQSPVRAPGLARALRAIWEVRDPRRALAARLLRDLRSRTHGHGIAPGAAERLARYYPGEADDAVAARVDSLPPDPEETGGDEVDVMAVLEALAPFRNESIRAAVVRALRRSRWYPAGLLDVASRVAGSPEQLLVRRLQRWTNDSLVTVPDRAALREDLAAAAIEWPAAAREALRLYAKTWPELRWKEALSLVDEMDAGVRPVLLRVLLDVDEVFWSDPPLAADAPAPTPLRVSDRAAVRVAALRPDLPYDASALQRERDARIRAMRAALDAEAR